MWTGELECLYQYTIKPQMAVYYNQNSIYVRNEILTTYQWRLEPNCLRLGDLARLSSHSPRHLYCWYGEGTERTILIRGLHIQSGRLLGSTIDEPLPDSTIVQEYFNIPRASNATQPLRHSGSRNYCGSGQEIIPSYLFLPGRTTLVPLHISHWYTFTESTNQYAAW